MTRSEFGPFQVFMFVRFNELESWMDRMTESRREETIEAWWEVLRTVGLDDAKQAVRRLHSGEETEPRTFSAFPSVIAGIARRLARAEAETPWEDVNAEVLRQQEAAAQDPWIPAREAVRRAMQNVHGPGHFQEGQTGHFKEGQK